ncbi:hypothetical protein DJ84_15965, partial [Halorubrum ezzemoulense]
MDDPWGELPEPTRVRRASDGGSGATGESESDGGPERLVVRLREDGDDGGASGQSGSGRANADLAAGDGAVATDGLRALCDRYPDATILAYTVDDAPDAAIDASRLG